jgi:tetraacyldisaccharide 4'-kinase
MVVHADRGRIAQEKWNEIRAEFVILDDAFQHWRVCRDFDLVAIDLTGPILPMLVPVGRARELPQALQRADAIVFTRAGEVSEAEAKKKIAELERFFQNEAKENCLPAPWKRGERGQSGLIPFFATTYQASELRHADGMVEPSEALKKRDMIIASGIANPRSFRVLIESLGANVVAEIKKPDHHWLTEKDLQEFLEVQQNNPRALLVITEKDAARWQGPLATNFDQFAFLTVRPKFLGPEVFGSRFRNGQELFPIVRGKL